ncbi:hypothetical protein AAFF_G00428630 [Aldrovandia affinis]|uniref:Uncharacterized protein n=1 Tax=Aldrovandia affinis TaxID=143900 RepID=A0AAD7WIQ0_9TELE|nr:hypothetical protein AAFF_G00428630 [Aldrovandia affinis]
MRVPVSSRARVCQLVPIRKSCALCLSAARQRIRDHLDPIPHLACVSQLSDPSPAFQRSTASRAARHEASRGHDLFMARGAGEQAPAHQLASHLRLRAETPGLTFKIFTEMVPDLHSK